MKRSPANYRSCWVGVKCQSQAPDKARVRGTVPGGSAGESRLASARLTANHYALAINLGHLPLKLPNFLIIGAAKAGTTSLYHYFAQHPGVFMSPVKEPRFLALESGAHGFAGPNDEYVFRESCTTLESYATLFEGARDGQAVGEASTMYLDSESAPETIRRLLPGVRLIAILRDPAERAYSAFLNQTRLGTETETDFARALALEPERRAAGWFHFWRYRERGYYYHHLRRYYEQFPASQIHVCLYEDLQRDPQSLMSDLFRFLGVEPSFTPATQHRHNASTGPSAAWRDRVPGRVAIERGLKMVLPESLLRGLGRALRTPGAAPPPLDSALRAELAAGYRDDITGLEQLIGRDLSAWKL
jgi:hypothetical protein